MPKIASSYKTIFFLLVFCAFGTRSTAQETEETFLLSYLKSLEQKYDVRFSYVRKEVDEIKLKPLSKKPIDGPALLST